MIYLSQLADNFQSGVRPLHSNETALIKVVNYISLNTDFSKFMLLDLSAAFNTLLTTQYFWKDWKIGFGFSS